MVEKEVIYTLHCDVVNCFAFYEPHDCDNARAARRQAARAGWRRSKRIASDHLPLKEKFSDLCPKCVAARAEYEEMV